MQNQLEYLQSKLQNEPDLKYVLIASNWQTDFLRFYHSQTNYNISKSSTSLGVTLYKGRKSYRFSVDDPQKDKLDQALGLALSVIDSLPEDPDFVDVENENSLAPKREIVNNIAAIPLESKTRILAELAEAAKPFDFEIFGTFICNYSEHHLVNSNGLNKKAAVSPIYLEVKAVHNQSQVTVMETFGGDDFSLFNLADFKARLLNKIGYCSAETLDIEPGHYEVILAPRCLAEFVQYLSFGMSARALDQHSSFFEGKIDQKLFPDFVSITDDPTDPEMIRQDYGAEGHIYKPLKLIEKGVFRAFTCNNYYAHKTGLPKNGNTASCLKVDTGDKTLEELIGGVKRGLYISSLHYMNFINPVDTSLTGLTRDGTFLIENGKISKVVMSLRFTERIDRILNNVAALENKAYTIPFSENYGSFDVETVKAPHAHILDFNISSSTHTI